MSNRFSIFTLLTITAVVALYTSLIGDVTTAWLIAYCVVLVFLPAFFIWCFRKLRYLMAQRCVPWLYRHKKLWLAERIFGFQNSALALNEEAVRLLRDGKAEAACELLDKALELDASFPTLWSNRGDCRARLGRLDDAKADANRALQIDAEHEQALTLRGIVRILQADYAGGLGDLEQIECTHPRHFKVAFYRAMAHEQLKQWQPAIADYLLASGLDATFVDAALGLTRIQACCPADELRDGRKALENASALCQRTNWQDWVAISVLAAAYAECDNFPSALKYAQMALELAPEDEKASRVERIEQYQRGEPRRL